MQYFEVDIEDKTGYLLPIGDLHIGDKAFTPASASLLDGYLKWAKEHKAKIVLIGDIFNCATRISKTSPFEQKEDELNLAINLFKPYRENLVGAINGNHEKRFEDFAGFSLMSAFCLTLGIPYFGNSVVINFRVNKRRGGKEKGRFEQNYTGYFHHTTGGGNTVGGKMNRVAKLQELVSNCDFYVGGHNHQLGVVPIINQLVDVKNKKVIKQKQLLIDAGSYLEWNNSYAEAGMLRPTKLGSVRIRMDGNKKDLHASI